MGNKVNSYIEYPTVVPTEANPATENRSSVRRAPDHRSNHSGTFRTVDAPWNVTQWIDPLDPHPKVTTIPLILAVRR